MARASFAGSVDRRLRAAGHGRGRIFTPLAAAAIQRASHGIPRLVNTLCHKSLLSAWADGECRVRRVHARRACQDSECLAGWRRVAFARGRASMRPTPATARGAAPPVSP